MKAEKSHSQKPKREFGGCVELIPTRPDYTEFIADSRLWVFAINHLTHFVLQADPFQGDKKSPPRDQLILVYSTAYVSLYGWRLEQLIDPFIHGRVARIHAEQHLGTLMIEEAWVDRIVVQLRDNTVLRTKHTDYQVGEES